MISLAFSISCLSFLIILAIFYFTKKKIVSVDNKIYTGLLVTNLIGIFMDVLGFFCFRTFGTDFILNIFLSKIYLIYYLTYIFMFMLYIYNVSFDNLKKVFPILSLTLVFASLMVLILPVSVHLEGNVAYSYGVGVNLADLTKNKLNINKVLDEVKKHPDIAPLIPRNTLPQLR